jgi:hypothetical protein
MKTWSTRVIPLVLACAAAIAAPAAHAQVNLVYSTYVPQGAIANRQNEAYLAEL